MKVVVKKDSADIFPHLYEGTVLREVSEKGEWDEGQGTGDEGFAWV